MARIITAGATSQSIDLFVQDSSSTTGAGLAALAYNTSGLKAYYRLGATGSATAITLATQTVGGAYSSGGFVEIDATNMKGVYRLDLPDAAVASGPYVTVYLYGATNAAPTVKEIQLTAPNLQDGVRIGITALPNAVAGASGGIVINGSNTGTITISDGFVVNRSSSNSDAVQFNGNGSGVGLKCTGGATGAGAKFIGGGTSGDGIDISTTAGDGLAITPTAGNAIVATANGTSKHGAVITGGTAGTSDGVKCVAGTGGVDLRAAITGSITGSLSGSAGSVTAGVTVTTNNDKTGYALTASYDPAKTAAQAGDVMKVSSGTGANQISLSSGVVTVGTNNDKTGYALTAAYDAAKTAAQAGDVMKVSSGTGANQISLSSGTVTVGTNNDKTGYGLTSAYDFAKGTAAMAESYAANGVAPTPIQSLFAMHQMMMQFAISGTSYTVNKLDNSTTAFVVTLDSASSPSSAVRT